MSIELFDILTIDYNKAQDILNIPEVYTTVVTVGPSVARPAGVYEFTLSLTYQLSVTNRSVYLRFSDNGGATWNEFTSEPKDTTDREPHFYSYPFVHAGGPFHAIMEMRKEDVSGTLNCFFADLMFKRIG